jgi:hypothetical protein
LGRVVDAPSFSFKRLGVRVISVLQTSGHGGIDGFAAFLLEGLARSLAVSANFHVFDYISGVLKDMRLRGIFWKASMRPLNIFLRSV